MTEEEMQELMLKLAKENGVEPTENLPKIARARIRMHLDITECPCHKEDKDRGCISAKCLREIKENGICCCTAYRRKEQQ